MSDTMDPFVWTEPAPLPDPTLVDFFTSPLPESPPPIQITPDTPSNSTHPWESELATLQEQNSSLHGKLADVPRLLAQLDRQKAELAAARRRLVAVETDRVRLQDRVERLERVAKRPRVDNLCCACGKKRERVCGLSEWLDRFALADVADFAPEVRTFVTVLKDARREQTPDKVAHAVFSCLLHADEHRSLRILRRIAAAALIESVIVPALMEGILSAVKKEMQECDANPMTTNDVVRVLLQGTAAGVWTKRTAAEVLAAFVTSHREAGDLLRLVLSSNEKVAREVMIDSTDGRDLNLLWGPSLQAVVTFFTNMPTEAELNAGGSSDCEGLLCRWNDVRTTVEDLQDHASLSDAETGLLLELSMTGPETCFEVTVRKALFEQVPGMAKQAEKVEKMLGLVKSLTCVLKKEETEGVQKCMNTVPIWLVSLACEDDVEPRLAVTAINMAVQMVSERRKESIEVKELKAGLVQFSQRKIGDENRKLLSEKAVELLQEGDVMK